ncbi:hypothetical protein PGT21_031405 [Puccinia graminis f. sp. tritici]|uniref:Uncharacterized protein n=1 Tax=Puccinia graminis f. sp. tritici TaxID=56615 RepID=A0A5B0PE49_PUCGR|nr:hypothetical protein PGTUg99_005072 [Puccinia graminis f. sp. tritici]KAA1104769.1 hypothetical protein PGT21_031405 [Puccinia graminis f. sp. tritici]
MIKMAGMTYLEIGDRRKSNSMRMPITKRKNSHRIQLVAKRLLNPIDHPFRLGSFHSTQPSLIDPNSASQGKSAVEIEPH